MDHEPNKDREMEQFESDLLQSVRHIIQTKLAAPNRMGGDGRASGRRRRDAGPRVAINIMAPETVAGPFITWCDENRYTYWEGLAELMRRACIS